MIITNVPERVVEVEDVGRLGKSDHCMVSAKVNIMNNDPVRQSERQNWARANWQETERDLGRVDWAKRF